MQPLTLRFLIPLTLVVLLLASYGDTASALGPSAEYRLTLGDGDESCAMRIVSVWDLNDQDLIIRESIFYHPDTIFDCGWEPADT